MRILIVCKANFEPSELNFQKNRAYVYDQYVGLKEYFQTVEVFFLRGRGIMSYVEGAIKLRKYLNENKFDIVHAHYGYCGLIAGLISKVPVVVTYHGSDITEKLSNVISLFSIFFARWNIFVTEKLYKKSIWSPKKNFSIIPCGVDLDLFKPIELEEREKNEVLGTANKKILFSSSFSNPVKNYPLAKNSFFLLKNPKASLIELKDKSRNEVVKMLNACDVLLMTSYSEGSPQIIKEAMACNCPIVSTDVGDVKKNIGQSYNCFVTGFDKNDIAEKIRTVLENGNRSNGREFIMEFNNGLIIRRIFDVYNKIELATKFDSKH